VTPQLEQSVRFARKDTEGWQTTFLHIGQKAGYFSIPFKLALTQGQDIQ
jgi:hypothetical protein